MSRLTIIIPFFNDTPMEAFEETLASVLVHRPEGSEILIANGTSYSDPWNTANEGVVFLSLDRFNNPVDILNEAVRRASGDIIHILWSGTEVTVDWSIPSLELFDDPQVGIVVPSVYDRRKPKRVFSFGIHYKPEGVLRTIRRSHWAEASNKTIVPHISAVFFRAEAVRNTSFFDRTLIPQIAYVDLAMTLAERGWNIVVAQKCRIMVRPNHLPTTSPFVWGMQTERIYFRWLGGHGSFWTLGAHFSSFFVDFWRHFPRLKCYKILSGRLFGLLFFGEMIPFVRQFQKGAPKRCSSKTASGTELSAPILTRLSGNDTVRQESVSGKKSA